MFDRTSRVAGTQSRGGGGGGAQPNLSGLVYHVILDETDSVLTDLEVEESSKTQYVGAIQFRLQGAQSKSEDSLSVAFPKNLTFNRLPLKNEVVGISKGTGGGFYYELVTKSPTPNISSTDKNIAATFSKSKGSSNKSSNYSKVAATGIARSSGGDSTEVEGYGDYFEYTPTHKLKLYEGDTVIESRFGQSIRFSGYNNGENLYSPTIFIRNVESGLSQQKEISETVEEDLNRDGTIILLGSGDYIFEFKPGTVDDKGKSDFETKPDSFKTYPSELKGNQLLLSSDRMILSAKAGEMIFYSKKNYGFISDGGLSIDNKFGIDITVGDNININTNDRNVSINSGNGKINLGDKSLESLVRGETLVDLMTQLIDAITQQVFLTPAGPSSPGPTNIAVFLKIKSQLRTMLSTLNKTS
jgi:hypothetical protein